MVAIYLDPTPIKILDAQALDRLEALAKDSEQLRARYCLHQDHNDAIHQMVIALVRGTRIPIHRHQNKIESFHMIRGRIRIEFYDGRGQKNREVELDADSKAHPFLYRLSESLWHTVVPVSAVAVFHEITTGPFVENDHEFLEI